MYRIAALYHFTRFPDPAALQAPLRTLCEAQAVRGSLLLAREGINGTIAGPPEGIDRVLAHIRALPGCSGLHWHESHSTDPPFGRLKVRLKPEIVRMGQPDVDPRARVGHYVEPAAWNDLIRQPDVTVIDTRNDFEVAIGTFEGAVDPQTESFGDFPKWWAANAHRFAGRRIAMFCTGGIRCEKSTNYLLGQGARDVYHLKGGILSYLEEIPERDSLWQGDCFVFDDRVSVTHGLRPGAHILCHACRRPIRPEDTRRPEYEAGAACHLCARETSAADKARFRERKRQIDLARARGTHHLGAACKE